MLAGAVLQGCASSTSSEDAAAIAAPAPDAPHVRETAPTAQEMESALAAAESKAPVNGNGHAPALPPIIENPTPGVDEMVTIRTADYLGSAFPGTEAVQEPLVITNHAVPGPAAAPADARGGASEKQISELEARIAELERSRQAASTPDTNMSAEVRALREELAQLRAAQQPAPTDLGPIESELNALQDELKQLAAEIARVSATPESADSQAADRIAALEAEVARLQQDNAAPAIPADVVETNSTRIIEIEQELEALRGVSREPLKEVEQKIADLESQLASMREAANRKATPAVETASAERVAALEAEVAQLRKQNAESGDDAAMSARQARRMAELEAQIRALGEQNSGDVLKELAQFQEEVAALRLQMASAVPPAVDTAAIDARFASLESQLQELRTSTPRTANTVLAPGEAAPVGEVSVAAALPPAHAFEPPMPESFDSYKIGAGDLLEFQSFNDPALAREITVRYDGNISLPLIPDQYVAERTREEAETLVRNAYRTVFRDPQISLLVRTTTSKQYTIIGDVEQPGLYPYTGTTKLIDAISLAGGLRRRSASSSVGGFVGITGQLTKAMIVRHRNGERMVIQYDLRGLGMPGTHAADAPVYYGDLIYLPEGVNLVYLLGESSNPVIVELTEGMTLLQMLALSGGFNASTAKLRNVVLIRQLDEERSRVMKMNVREMLRRGTDFPLNPGDIVFIPQKTLVRLSDFVGRSFGSLSTIVGLYNSAVDAYYGADIARAVLNTSNQNRTLDVLNQLEDFGSSTQNLFNLFGAP